MAYCSTDGATTASVPIQFPVTSAPCACGKRRNQEVPWVGSFLQNGLWNDEKNFVFLDVSLHRKTSISCFQKITVWVTEDIMWLHDILEILNKISTTLLIFVTFQGSQQMVEGRILECTPSRAILEIFVNGPESFSHRECERKANDRMKDRIWQG